MDVNEHGRLSNFTLRHICSKETAVLLVILLFYISQ